MRRRAKPTKGYRSQLEARVAPALLVLGAEYEPASLAYTLEKKYTPDLVLPNGIALEIKGYFPPSDRAKMKAVKARYPGLDIRMVLSAPHTKLSKRSKTTYAQWCDQHCFPWCSEAVPMAWVREPHNAWSALVIQGGRKKKVA